MSMRKLVFVGVLVLLAGCAGQGAPQRGGQAAPPMTTNDYYAFCSALPTPAACISDPICQRYRKELSEPPADLPGCLSLCRQTYNALYVDNLINGCSDILERAWDLCEQFCRRHEAS